MKFIFQVKLRPGHSEHDYIEAWKNSSAIIQPSDGAEGTWLYRKIGQPDTFLAIANWESIEARDEAMKKLSESGAEIQSVYKKHNEHGTIHIVGTFEEVANVKGGSRKGALVNSDQNESVD
ncbi:MAG: antibiotic biosynthesis monooxygenase [Candidatus Kerfeldbacteria bacterium]|nr:antibiotic biosynthesis monooxygenase [Candidatus Kerfeldbacteria bacterium]